MTKAFVSLAILLVVAGLISASRPSTAAATTWTDYSYFYFIDEVTTYQTGGTGCIYNGNQLPNLNAVTASMASWISTQPNIWQGSRYTDANAWPQDWWDSCISGGLDSTYADSGLGLAVFAGHGSASSFVFGTPHPAAGACTVSLQNQARLGNWAHGSGVNAANGATPHAATAMWLYCDALAISSIPTQANAQWLWMQFGWTNSIPIGDNEPKSFMQADFGASYATDAWLNQMGGSSRHPIVVAQGTSASDCSHTLNNFSFTKNGGRDPRPGGSDTCNSGQPAFYYCYLTK